MRSVIIIDRAVLDYQSLLDSLPSDADVLFLDSNTDGITQLMEYLADQTGIDALHILSHGAAGTLFLGSTVLTNDTLADYACQFQAIGASLNPTGDILLYGCNVAQGEQGTAFIKQFAELTGADVVASIDPSGPAALGGDWELEAATGTVETASLMTIESAYLLMVNSDGLVKSQTAKSI